MNDSQEKTVPTGGAEETTGIAAPVPAESTGEPIENANEEATEAAPAVETAVEAAEEAETAETVAPETAEETAVEAEEEAETAEVVAPEAAEETAVETTEEAETAEAVAPEAAEETSVETTEKTAEEAETAEEEAPEASEEKTAATKETTTAEPVVPKVYATKKDVLARAKEMVENDDFSNKGEIDQLKTTFYKLLTAEREAAMKEYIDGGGDPEKYQVLPDEDETAFKAVMAVIRDKRSQLFQQQEADKQANLEKKTAIINKIKALITSPEEASKSYQEFQQLQQQWREIKAVPAEKAGELWRSYQFYREQYYDLLKLNNEAREMDFRKNYEKKVELCEAAEKLAVENDVISAFHQLQELHQQYREIGPVSKELREEIWARFKAASTVVNKRHQQHFEELRAKESKNLEKKTALCEKAEELAAIENKTVSEWEKRTKEIIALQKEWKTIGYAPQKMNVKIFERFRGVCDDFFSKKAAFFKTLKETTSSNIAKKKALVEKAVALSTSTDWKDAGDQLVALQKEWKTIGGVPKKLGDQLWNDFITACNTFFSARNANSSSTYSVERANLEKKRTIVAQIASLAEGGNDGDAQEKLQELVDAYNAVGHVPFKEKDKVYKEYRTALDKVSKELGMSTWRRRGDGYKGGTKATTKREEGANDERSKLTRKFEQLKQEVKTYENNIGFLSAGSKKGSSLIDEMNKKMQKLKDDVEVVRRKLIALDEKEDKDEA